MFTRNISKTIGDLIPSIKLYYMMVIYEGILRLIKVKGIN